MDWNNYSLFRFISPVVCKFKKRNQEQYDAVNFSSFSWCPDLEKTNDPLLRLFTTSFLDCVLYHKNVDCTSNGNLPGFLKYENLVYQLAFSQNENGYKVQFRWVIG